MQEPFPLPHEIHRRIFELCGIDAVFSLSRVNKFCHKLANDDLIWGKFYERSFGDSYFAKMAARHFRREKSSPNVLKTLYLRQAKATLMQYATSPIIQNESLEKLDTLLKRISMHPVEGIPLLEYHLTKLVDIRSCTLLIWYGADVSLLASAKQAPDPKHLNYLKQYAHFVNEKREKQEIVDPIAHLKWEDRLHSSWDNKHTINTQLFEQKEQSWIGCKLRDLTIIEKVQNSKYNKLEKEKALEILNKYCSIYIFFSSCKHFMINLKIVTNQSSIINSTLASLAIFHSMDSIYSQEAAVVLWMTRKYKISCHK